ncbi:Trigger factor [Caulifigura coniformis]|uniref:Trigger factor n=1 Tax=Caulifigura coniformis TaxID=2527983 RepID=A0A517SGM7_9PLAN|nr:trigger factor [Caulifigura coniformis]QDT55247.1 Trigger factor [Caulifigura coniformis]
MAEKETAVAEAVAPAPGEAKLKLDVEVSPVGPCKKHVRVKIARASLDEVEGSVIDRFAGEAQVPGFRVGHVPLALVKKRFKKELNEQIKQRVLMQSLEQLADEKDLDPINEPKLDLDAIDIPDDGDFEYEFDVEVRPEFDLPKYKGLKIERPVREISEQDIDDHLSRYLEQYGQLTPIEEPARDGDFLTVNIEFAKDGEVVKSLQETSLRVRPTLRFADGEITGFDKLMTGVKAGDVKEATVTVSLEAPTIELRGEKVTAKFEVLDVKRLDTPELNEEFLTRLNVTSEESLRKLIRGNLERQVTYTQRQQTRSQVLGQITESAKWDLPEELVSKQVNNALRREILEMQQAGFTSDEILTRQNELRQKSLTMTRRNLKEHFVLDRIAEEEKLEVTGQEINDEILLMALQSGENPRRVRSRLQKSGVIENLEAQIRERKAVDVILESATFKDVPMELPASRDVYSVEYSICPETEAAEAEVAAEE